MLRHALRRSAWTLVQLAALSVIVFLLTNLLPGDAATVDFNEQAGLEQVGRLREQMGLDRPVAERFADWAHGLLTGDLGTSLVGGGPVSEVLSSSLPVTAALAVVTLVLLVPPAVAVGLLTGLREGSRTDRVVSSVTLTLTSVPDFVLALLLVGVFALRLGWLPSTWVGADEGWWRRPELFVLPVVVLLCRTVCALSRQVRAGTVTALHAGYAVQARRLGVPPARLVLRHVLPNAAVPGVQELARTGDQLLGGVLIVEAVFAIPGTATALVEAVQNRDVPTVQALTLTLAAVACLLNLVADLVAHRLAPRSEVLR
ncbi:MULTISPECIES: ABC transporter permease [unclassified Streptomyces]|uniref:ABC transporter permease n=1 Tax=unclassified Streptomyces TaxID=2593676 RepID=UPI002ED3AFFF|nr:ABC transporter permease [Streptomyces sp. NBC_00891]WSY03951.1 ABC transporter permease [Streptomyces sp. NBC_00890]WSZ05577.1 ABC transporter permease [Streptomyces sp. NBC_00869]WSZ26927.1 ABC transporter permease [Streptomyces sp. NBC_00870]